MSRRLPVAARYARAKALIAAENDRLRRHGRSVRIFYDRTVDGRSLKVLGAGRALQAALAQLADEVRQPRPLPRLRTYIGSYYRGPRYMFKGVK